MTAIHDPIHDPIHWGERGMRVAGSASDALR